MTKFLLGFLSALAIVSFAGVCYLPDGSVWSIEPYPTAPTPTRIVPPTLTPAPTFTPVPTSATGCVSLALTGFVAIRLTPSVTGTLIRYARAGEVLQVGAADAGGWRKLCTAQGWVKP